MAIYRKKPLEIMPIYREKPVEIEAISFTEFVQYAKENGGKSINYKGHIVTYMDAQCYVIPTLEGTHHLTPDDMLITGIKGEIYPCKVDIFAATYEPVEA